MFCVIKSKLDNPIVRMLVGESAGDKSTEATDNKIVEFRRRDDFNLYGWIENDKILGVCGIEVFPDWVEIYNIAVVPEIRKRGIGKAMITAVQQKYQTNVKAETDDGAVEFYRKCGFKIEGFIKTYSGVESQRYKCVFNYNSGCRK